MGTCGKIWGRTWGRIWENIGAQWKVVAEEIYKSRIFHGHLYDSPGIMEISWKMCTALVLASNSIGGPDANITENGDLAWLGYQQSRSQHTRYTRLI